MNQPTNAILPRFALRTTRNVLALALWLANPGVATSGNVPAYYEETRPLMGTAVRIASYGEQHTTLERATAAAFAEMQRLSDMMSHYDDASVVSAINRAAGLHPVPVPAELMQVLIMAERVSRRTDGAFDATVGALTTGRPTSGATNRSDAADIRARRALVDYRRVRLDPTASTAYLERRGMRLDLGGIAKQYILDAGRRVLQRHGIRRALVDGGGDAVMYGAPVAAPWRVGVRDPRTPSGLLGVIKLQQGWVVSSGDYERFVEHGGRREHHIIDPRTGHSSEGPRHVTLVAEKLELVNGYGPAIMVLGADAGKRFITDTPGLAGLIVARDSTLWVSPSLGARFQPAAHAP